MIKQTITYTDYLDEEHTEDFYFNISKKDLAKMAIIEEAAPEDSIQKIIASGDPRRLMDAFEDLILKAYGIRMNGGREFHQSSEISARFKGTGAYDSLFLKMVTDADFALQFYNGLVPASVNEQKANAFQRPQTQDHQPKQTKDVELPAVSAPIPVYDRPPHENNAGVVEEWPPSQA